MEHHIFFCIFFVPTRFRDRGGENGGPGTLERVEEFKGIKDYAPRSRFQAPQARPRPPSRLRSRPRFARSRQGVQASWILAWLCACPLALNRGSGDSMVEIVIYR